MDGLRDLENGGRMEKAAQAWSTLGSLSDMRVIGVFVIKTGFLAYRQQSYEEIAKPGTVI